MSASLIAPSQKRLDRCTKFVTPSFGLPIQLMEELATVTVNQSFRVSGLNLGLAPIRLLFSFWGLTGTARFYQDELLTAAPELVRLERCAVLAQCHHQYELPTD